jgi:hypothetical protein
MHKYAVEIIGQKQTQVIQPWMFGHMEKKSTCLWLKNLPPLRERDNVKTQTDMLPIGIQQKVFYQSPGKLRGKIRSLTYQGIADAMAEQWGAVL